MTKVQRNMKMKLVFEKEREREKEKLKRNGRREKYWNVMARREILVFISVIKMKWYGRIHDFNSVGAQTRTKFIN